MIKATSELKKLVENKHVTATNEHNIQGAGIDLSIAEIARIRKQNTDIDLFEVNDHDDLSKNIYEEVHLAQGYKLPPLSYLYATTNEKIKMPNTLCGLVVSRSSFARMGLILPLSPYVSPGYEGHLSIIIFNAAPCNITIPPYIRIAQLLFFEICGEALSYTQSHHIQYQKEPIDFTLNFDDTEAKAILETTIQTR